MSIRDPGTMCIAWITAISELLCPFGRCARSSLHEGGADLDAVGSGYGDSEIAIAKPARMMLKTIPLPRNQRQQKFRSLTGIPK